jgi:hypothetical protein
LHDGNHTGSVTITPTNGTGSTDLLSKFKQEHLSKSFSGNSGAKIHKILRHSASPSVADIQRKVAQRKLQMAKMMGHNVTPSGDFRKHQGHQMNHQMMMSDYHNDPLQVASRRARSNNFTLNETFALLKIWASPEMQWQMRHVSI